jgi:hypothetical protein
MMRILVWFIVVGFSDQSQQPPVSLEDTQPRVEIRLSPPRHPLPSIVGKIEVLDATRKRLEERLTAKLLKSYDEEIKRSRKLISGVIRDALEVFDDPAVIPPREAVVSSFIYLPDWRMRPGRIFVSVEPQKPIDGIVGKRIESIEERNTKEEIEEVQGLIDDMHGVTRYTVQNLHEALVNVMRPVIKSGNMTVLSSLMEITKMRCQEIQNMFPKTGPANCDHEQGANAHHLHQITAFADEHKYPTVESLVKEMLQRRELDEELFRSRSLTLMAKLARKQSNIITELLQAAVATIQIQYKEVIHATNLTRAENELRRSNASLTPRIGTKPDPTDSTK